MSTDDRSASRAEARRRARLAARGEPDTAEPGEPDPEPRRDRGGFLSRIFPPAPPLPNRPDPLAGYAGSGPLRPISERVFLLRRNPLAWLVSGLGAFAGLIASLTYGSGVLGLVGTFLLFGSLIAAGWFGWQRPTLYGTAAALLGYLVALSLIFFSFSSRGAGAETFGTAAQVIGGFVLQGVYYSGLGFVGGWYGGYLRRRQTQLSGARQQPRQPPRRRR